MDTDLFQILTLFLLLGLLLTLFGVFLSIGAIRKTLEERPGATAEQRGAAPVAATPAPVAAAAPEPDDDSPSTWARPDDAVDVARSGWPSPAETSPEREPEPEPATRTPVSDQDDGPAQTETAASAAATSSRDAGARVLYGDTGLTTATPADAALRTSEPEETEPAAQSQPAQAEPETQRAGSSDDPQEQPFERDGRWWFRRGDELLVYEEQTGQWVAASEPSTSGSVATTADAGRGAASSAAATPAAEGQVTTQQEAAGSFWKCPSCGAVNGSTATSCRMCFTARP